MFECDSRLTHTQFVRSSTVKFLKYFRRNFFFHYCFNMSTHCLICNLTLEESHKHFNVFTSVCTNTEEMGTSVAETLFGILAKVLKQSLAHLPLHSEVICEGCYLKVLDYYMTHNKLQKLELSLISLFDQTVLSHRKLDRSVPTTNSKSPDKLSVKTIDQCSQFNSVSQLIPSDLTKDISEVVDAVIAESDKGGSDDLNKKQGNISEEGSDVGKQYVCEKCGEIFNTNSHWVEHMGTHIDIKTHKCSQCSKQFRTMSSLKVHERSHLGVKPYECEICGKFFSERHYLTEHLHVHAKHKPFKCSECNREFSRRKDMNTHMKIHSEDRPYSCLQCPKKFVVRSRLNRHLKSHSTDRPYKCTTCQKSFFRQNDFKVHERLHTGVKPYKCATCNNCFTSVSNCRAHERRCHKTAPKVKTTNDSASVEVEHLDPKYVTSAIQIGGQLEMSLKRDNVIISEEINPQKNRAEIMASPKATGFSISCTKPDDMSTLPDHLPPLANFDDESAINKSVLTPNSTLPLNSDLTNVTLSSDGQNISSRPSLVLMQIPLLPEPPPLLPYSTARDPDNLVHFAGSMQVDSSSENILNNATQIFRWNNLEEGENINLYNDNSNWSLARLF